MTTQQPPVGATSPSPITPSVVSQERNRSAQGGNIKPPEHKTKCRGMCFTRYQMHWPIEFNSKTMKYLCYGTEVCPTTGREHYQGFVYWKNPRYPGSVAKQYSTAFFPMKGTIEQAVNYCKKDGKFEEFGEMPKQGRRTDLEELAQKLVNGETTVDDITINEPIAYHQYGRTLEKIEDIVMRKKFRTEMTSCEWLVGPTGVGKSHIAFKGFSPETHYIYRPNDKGWWEGYKQQETVIINDFRGQIPYDELLQIIDKWAYYVPRRGREPMPFTSKKVIITSPLTPEEAYPRRMEKDDIAQLLRRVHVTVVEKPASYDSPPIAE